MLKLKKVRFTYIFSFILIVTIFMISCTTPRSGKYRNHRHVGSSSFYRQSNIKRAKARRNVQPISKNYRIKNKRSSGNY